MKTRLKPSKIIEIVGWCLLAVILIVAIVYYNAIYKEETLPEVYAVGDECPSFEFEAYKTAGYQEAKYSSESSRGKVLVINFWYVNCGGCKAELPHFNDMQNKYSDQVDIVVVHSATIDTDVDKQASIDELGYNAFSMIFVQDEPTLNLFKKLGGKGSWPMTVIVDKDGIIRSVHQGGLSQEQLENAITPWL